MSPDKNRMKRGGGILAAGIFAMALVASAIMPAHQEGAPFSEKEIDIPGIGKGTETTTPHFAIRSNLGEKDRKESALLAEEVYAKFKEVFSPYTKIEELSAPLVVNITNSAADYDNLIKARKVSKVSKGGFYNINLKETFLWNIDEAHRAENYDGTLKIVLSHELVHQLEHNILGIHNEFFAKRRDLAGNWMTEAIASYFENFVFKTDVECQKKKLAHFAKAISQFVPPSEFCNYDWQRWMRMSFMSGPTSAYGESTALFHYMMRAESGKYSAKFITDAVLAGKGDAKTLSAILGRPVKEIDGGFKEYAKSIFQ